MAKELDKSVFNDVLNENEEIVGICKPHKFGFTFLYPFWSYFFGFVFIVACLIMVFAAPFEEEESIGAIIAVFCVPGLFGLAVIAISAIRAGLRYKNTVYCYTNKRIIIRSGVIGIDFEFMDYDLIGGISVSVDFRDKLVKPNTGSIVFSSASGSSCWYCIQNPYEVYKEIKSVFDKCKEEK